MASPAASNPAPSNPPGGSPSRSDAPGFFRIYKSSQGYWTRLGTALGATMIILFTAAWLWQQIPAWLSGLTGTDKVLTVRLSVILPVIAGLTLFSWWMMNKPSRAEFLIETDNEMKRINWASRKDLVGSTRVVIFFMLATAFVLFFYDQLFQLIFWLLSVLRTPPLGF